MISHDNFGHTFISQATPPHRLHPLVVLAPQVIGHERHIQAVAESIHSQEMNGKMD